MSNFNKAIDLIMAEPTELHYPAYFADLLRKADVPDTNDGDTISRKAAIDALRTCYDTETISMDNGDEYINYGDAVGEIEQLPSAEPDIAEKLYQHKCYITDQEGLQHEVIHVGDIRRVTGWEI